MKNRTFRIGAIAALMSLLTISPLHARLTEIQFKSETAFRGETFGKVGAYKKITGKFRGELDPNDPRNAIIAGIKNAPLNDRGLVEYTSSLYILTPVDPSQGNATILYDLPNRGHKSTLLVFNDARIDSDTRLNNPLTGADLGNKFLMKHGYTLVWNGVFAGVDSSSNKMILKVPIARNPDGSKIVQTIWDEIKVYQNGITDAVVPYATPKAYQHEAKLLVRAKAADSPKEMPRSEWRFLDAKTIELKNRAFKPGYIYQLVHKAQDPHIMGIGLAAMRDLNSFLRYEKRDEFGNPNPLKSPPKASIAFGISQSGRTLRNFTYLGFNADERGRKIFDLIWPHVSVTHTDINRLFAQPHRKPSYTQADIGYPDQYSPVTYSAEYIPHSGREDGVLERSKESGTEPKVLHTVSDSEYAQLGQSLVTTDAAGTRDLPIPKNVRIYSFTGTAHSNYPSPGYFKWPHNDTNWSPFMRALLKAAQNWVFNRQDPPPSRYPKIADGTLVKPSGVRWPKMPKAVLVPTDRTVNKLPIFDYGPDFSRTGIITEIPPKAEAPRNILLPQVDNDGMFLGGLRLPIIEIPLGTYTGWAISEGTLHGELDDKNGVIVPFAKTRTQRLRLGDSRLSVQERYPNYEAYMKRVLASAEKLYKQGYLLREDLDLVVAEAHKTWEGYMKRDPNTSVGLGRYRLDALSAD